MTEEVNNLKDEKHKLQHEVIEFESTSDKIRRSNLLIDELNSEFYGLNVHELGKKINRKMFETVQMLNTDHMSKMEEFSKLITNQITLDAKDLEEALVNIENEREKIRKENIAKQKALDEEEAKKQKEIDDQKKKEEDAKKKAEEDKKKAEAGEAELFEKKESEKKEDEKKDDDKKEDAKKEETDPKKDDKKDDKKDAKKDKKKDKKSAKEGGEPEDEDEEMFEGGKKEEKDDKDKIEEAKPEDEKSDAEGEGEEEEEEEEKPLTFEEMTYKQRYEAAEDSNNKLRGLQAKVSMELDSYLKTLRASLYEIQDDYKGFIDLEDKEFFETMDKKRKEEEKDEDMDFESKYSQLKRDFAHVQLQRSETEAELNKASRKEMVIRSKLAELELNYDESMHSVSFHSHMISSVQESRSTRLRLG